MGTKSCIIVMVEDNLFHAVYCHWDGYPGHHWPILTQHYNTQERAESLVSHGFMSVLGTSNVGGGDHSYETPIDGETIYYGRDRGESDVGLVSFSTAEEAVSSMGEAFQYMFQDGVWLLYQDGAWTNTPVIES